MIPELIFWWALAVIAVLIAFWVVALTAVAIKELFKPRGTTVRIKMARDPVLRSGDVVVGDEQRHSRRPNEHGTNVGVCGVDGDGLVGYRSGFDLRHESGDFVIGERDSEPVAVDGGHAAEPSGGES